MNLHNILNIKHAEVPLFTKDVHNSYGDSPTGYRLDRWWDEHAQKVLCLWEDEDGERFIIAAPEYASYTEQDIDSDAEPSTPRIEWYAGHEHTMERR